MGDRQNKCRPDAPRARKQVTHPTRLAPWGGPAQNDSQDVQWGSRGKILRRGGGRRGMTSRAADGLQQPDWLSRIVRAVLRRLGWGYEPAMRSPGPFQPSHSLYSHSST